MMKQLFDFFENLDESVYISDAQTNDLIYLNAHLREMLGFASPSDYVGKKCYKVLQGKDAPCLFCTNQKLTPGHFYSWSHTNPLLKKTFLVKDTLVLDGDRRCRLEIAVDADTKRRGVRSHYHARSESILNGCLQEVFSAANPDEAIKRMLAYLGDAFSCARTYVFEVDESNLMSNTYEWCALGISEQKEILQKEPIDSISWWFDRFHKDELVILEDLEDIRTQYPTTYALLKPQGIDSLVVGPIRFENELIGFVGVDNPSKDCFSMVSTLISIIGYFLATQLRRRDLLMRLNRFSFYDPLTGAYNRNAMEEHEANRLKAGSVGVAYCDITGLKKINDSMGHHAGDDMICLCYNKMKDLLRTEWIYRTGGDEFVAVCPDIGQQELIELVNEFREHIKEDKYHIAIGYAWSDQQPVDLDAMISQADKVMYQDKRAYYQKRRTLLGIGQPAARPPLYLAEDEESLFHQFIRENYFNAESLFEAFTKENTSSYFYFGDMQRDIFYVSDNMRAEFGFESNIVPGLTQIWEQYIVNPKHLQLYREDLASIIQNKRTIHDLRYQVRKADGETIWIRCYGLIEWNEDQSKPLFFAGRVTHQDDKFVVDPITNLPRATVAFARLHEVQRSQKQELVIAFSLNNITEINNTRGRSFSDRLLKNIGKELMDKLFYKMSFFRLEGMRCMALVDSECTQSQSELIEEIRSIIENCYQEMDISMHSLCSFAVMRYPYDDLTPEDLMGHIISLIRVAKSEPDKPYIEYSPESVGHIRKMSKIALALNQDVINGMQNFRIVVQPVVNAQTGSITGGEVLLRWTFEGESISPAIFIPMLEKSEMIHIVGLWVFDQAARNCLRLISYIPDFYLTFNISLRQFYNEDFIPSLVRIIEKYHLDASHLVAEMTESCLDSLPESLARFAEMCSQVGMRIALDDFGSGYSSMRMLLRYPCDIIKLDRSLLEEIMESDKKMQFIRSIVYACHQFGKKVCMEGVETEEQDLLIRQTGCDMIQGFYYHRPMELPDLYHLLSRDCQ